MEKLTILELIDFIRLNWKGIKTLKESDVEHFFLQRSPIQLLLFVAQIESENLCETGFSNFIESKTPEKITNTQPVDFEVSLKDLLTTKEATQILKISKTRFYSLVNEGLITLLRFDYSGRKTFVRLSQISQLLKN